ncbi:MAG: hypothetical protein KDC45_15640 [Bacteroidetes bacterium]|nr:hypothetical protein [Bacteroidota bacterium]
MTVTKSMFVRNALYYAAPLLVLCSAAAVSLFILPVLSEASRPQLISAALVLDFTLVVPFLVYVLLVRTKRAPWLVLVPSFVLGYALAKLTIPAGNQAALDLLRFLALPVELTVITYLIIVARRAIKHTPAGGDFATRFRAAARTALSARVPADILTTEVAILYYAFHRNRTAVVPGSFTVHREAGYVAVVIGIGMAIVAETLALHFLISLWSVVFAWILTGLSMYSFIWITGDYRAMTARPVLVTSTHLLLRFGLRWEADIPLERIIGIGTLKNNKDKPDADTLVAALLGSPNVQITLDRPVEITGLYGIRRVVKTIRLRVDGSSKFCAALGA